MSFNDEQRRLLFEILTETFSDNDLRELCFALNFDYEDLPGEGKRGKARELVAHVKRLEQTAVLVAKVRALRPDANWQKFDQAISSGQPSRLNEPDDNITRTDIFDEWTRVFQDLGREVWEQDQRAQFERAHAIIRSVLLTRDSGNLPAVEEVVEVALWLWEQLYEEVRDIVIPCLIWADQSGGRERMYERFRAGKPKERRLLRDPRLSDIAPDLAQHWYN